MIKFENIYEKIEMKFKDGDVFDIKQTVNGCNTFIFINGEYRYFWDNKPQYLYEYDIKELISYYPDLDEAIEILKNIKE